jgi:acetylornithine deacetylase/succinyl-diaminopimelate desuccinylase-like protein
MISNDLLRDANGLIDDKEVLDLSRQLIRIPSQSRHEAAVGKFIFQKLDKWGLEPKEVNVEGNGPDIVAEIGKKKAPAIAFNGHMDTVEVMSGWRHDPYGATVEKGMLYGLGALDMKCGMAGLMVAFKAIAESRHLASSRVVFQAVSGEEENSSGTRSLLSNGELQNIKGVIVGEGFGGLAALTHGRRGGFYWDINITGKAAHGASPHLGINAISDAAKVVCALDSMKLRKARWLAADDSTALAESQTVLKISGGMSSLSVPEKCYVKVIRCPLPGSPGPREVQAEIERRIEGLQLRSRVQMTLQDGPGDIFYPHVTPARSSLVTTASRCVERLTGTIPQLVIGRSEADDNLIAHETGTPIICLGPGESGELAKYHQAEEAVHIDQLGPAARAYFMTALELCKD